MAISKQEMENARKYFELEQILLRTNPQVRDILVKANDGRGMGHISRVINFITYDLIRNRTEVIVNRKFIEKVPQGVIPIGVEDLGFRIDLDPYFNGGGVPKRYQKFAPVDNDGKIKLCGCIDQAISDYYSKIMSGIHSDTKLVYIDDQNSPETAFLDIIGKFIDAQFKAVKEVSNNAGMAIEMETQDVFRESMWQAYKRTRYIHLSSSMEFFKTAAGGMFSLRGLEDKVIAAGFPLSDLNKKKLDLNENQKETIRKELIDKYAESCNKFFYCTFGGGDGAEKVGTTICEAAKSLDKVLISISDTTGKIRHHLENKGYKVMPVEEEGVYKVTGKNGDLDNVYLNLKYGGDHLTTLAGADVILTAAGSGGTYEAIRTCNPMIILPLPRPGNEQDYKAAGVKKMGYGEILLVDECQTSKTLEFYKEVGLEMGEGINAFTNDSVSSLVENMLTNKEKYTSIDLAQRDKLFGTEEMIGKTIYLMAEHLEPGEIRYYLDLPSLR